jgi:hypothetical protein
MDIKEYWARPMTLHGRNIEEINRELDRVEWNSSIEEQLESADWEEESEADYLVTRILRVV